MVVVHKTDHQLPLFTVPALLRADPVAARRAAAAVRTSSFVSPRRPEEVKAMAQLAFSKLTPEQKDAAEETAGQEVRTAAAEEAVMQSVEESEAGGGQGGSGAAGEEGRG